MNDLVSGWKTACDVLGVAWGGGETPCLTGVVEESAIDLAVSCVGIIRPKSRLTLGENLAAGDAIILLESSGIHANGLTLARKLAERLPDGYATVMADGRRYGEALLDPTLLYPPVTEAAFRGRHRPALHRQHHRPRMAQAHAPPWWFHLPHHRSASRT